jgi:hypothetical protein
VKAVMIRGSATSCVGIGIVLAALLLPACGSAYLHEPTCAGKDDSSLVLAAQAVPSATLVPCIEQFPAGWTYSGSRTRSGAFTFWLDSDRAGPRAAEITLTRTCDVGAAVEVTAGGGLPGVRTFEEPISLPPRFQADRFMTFPGGCVTYEFRFARGAAATLALEAEQSLGFLDRADLDRRVKQDTGLILCGAGSPRCPG